MQNTGASRPDDPLFGSPAVTAAFLAAGALLASAGVLLWQRSGPDVFLDFILTGFALCA